MDILTYEYMLQGLKDYNSTIKDNYGNVVLKYPTNSTYPHVVFREIRNVSNVNFNTCHDRVSNVGYSADIYAKTKGETDKVTIARIVASIVDDYLNNIGIKTRVSYNLDDNVEDGAICRIVMTYSGKLHENRKRFI
jgi:hypothetical protein